VETLLDYFPLHRTKDHHFPRRLFRFSAIVSVSAAATVIFDVPIHLKKKSLFLCPSNLTDGIGIERAHSVASRLPFIEIHGISIWIPSAFFRSVLLGNVRVLPFFLCAAVWTAHAAPSAVAFAVLSTRPRAVEAKPKNDPRNKCDYDQGGEQDDDDDGRGDRHEADAPGEKSGELCEARRKGKRCELEGRESSHENERRTIPVQSVFSKCGCKLSGNASFCQAGFVIVTEARITLQAVDCRLHFVMTAAIAAKSPENWSAH
jgi:hypothetical protein